MDAVNAIARRTGSGWSRTRPARSARGRTAATPARSATSARSPSIRASRSPPARAAWSRRRAPTGRAGALAARPRRRPVRPRASRAARRIPARRLRRARLQLPDDRHPGRPRLRADGSRGVDPRGAPAPRARSTTRRSPTSTGCARRSRPPARPRLSVLLLSVRARGADAPASERCTSGATADGADGGARHRHAAGHARAGARPSLYAQPVRARRRGLPARRRRRAPDAWRCRLYPEHDRRRAGARGRASCWAPSRRSSVCGIAGVLERSGRPVARELLQRMGDVIAHRGPDGEGQHADGPVGLGQPPAGDHRPDAGRRDADGVRRRPVLDHLQRRGLQLPRAARGAARPPATASARTPTPRSC